jgi:hypothetical protein
MITVPNVALLIALLIIAVAFFTKRIETKTALIYTGVAFGIWLAVILLLPAIAKLA